MVLQKVDRACAAFIVQRRDAAGFKFQPDYGLALHIARLRVHDVERNHEQLCPLLCQNLLLPAAFRAGIGRDCPAGEGVVGGEGVRVGGSGFVLIQEVLGVQTAEADV